MLKSPLLSIIVPVYNHEAYVYLALKSIFQQTYSNWELIILDDGSKDASVEKIRASLKQLKGPEYFQRIELTVQQNQGAHATINRGLKMAKGDYLTILNSDDIYHPERFQLLIDSLVTEKREWGFTRCCAIDQHSKIASRSLFWWRWYEHMLFEMIQSPQYDTCLLKTNLIVSTGNLIFSRKLYDSVGEFAPYLQSHDYDYALRSLAVSDPVFLDQELYYYRLHPTNTLHKVSHLQELEMKQIHQNYISHVLPQRKNCRDSVHFSCLRLFQELDRAGLETFGSKLKASLKQEEETLPQLDSLSPGTPSKITLVTHELSQTGAPMVILEMAKALQNLGWSVNVLSLREGALRLKFEQLGIPIAVIPTAMAFWQHQPTRWKRMYWLGRLIAWTLRRSAPLTLANTTSCWSTVLGMSRAMPWRRFIWYIHDPYAPEAIIPQGFPESLLENARHNKNLKMWFGSKSIAEMWNRANFNGRVAYWSGIKKQPDRKETSAKPIRNLLAVGTVSPRKGTHFLIEAFLNGLESGALPLDCTLTIVGYESAYCKNDILMRAYCVDLMNQIAKSNYGCQVKVVASVDPDQLEALYDKADLFIHPALNECLPLAILMAMAKGLPIVATHVNGCAEVLQDGETAYLCPPRNSECLLGAIAAAVNNPSKTWSLAAKAKSHFDHHYEKQCNLKAILEALSEPFETSSVQVRSIDPAMQTVLN